MSAEAAAVEAGADLAYQVEEFLLHQEAAAYPQLRAALRVHGEAWGALDSGPSEQDCATCRGSGEGAASGTVCGNCRGSGVEWA